MTSKRNQSSDEEYDPAIDDFPEQFQCELKGLRDIARNPIHNPLATIAAFLIITIFVYLAIMTSISQHPILGLIVIGIAAIAYLISKALWQIQRQYMIRELARSGELDRNQD